MPFTGQVDPRDRWILHFTHVDNIGSIAQSSRLVSDAAARQGLLKIEAGDASIKEKRRHREVPVDPGGTIGDYVPFYFAPRSPMMYRIACDHRDSVHHQFSDETTLARQITLRRYPLRIGGLGGRRAQSSHLIDRRSSARLRQRRA